jgi:hypothetical protein
MRRNRWSPCQRVTILLIGLAAGREMNVVLGDDSQRPKYGPAAIRMFESREYIKRLEAADYWALAGYYMPQQDDRSCSVACAAMLINALRVERPLSASDELVTQQGLLETVDSDLWGCFRRTWGPAAPGPGPVRPGRISRRSRALRGHGARCPQAAPPCADG